MSKPSKSGDMGALNPSNLSIEVQLSLQRSPDGNAAPEAVLLALKHDKCGGDALLFNAVVHDLGLVWWHYLVFSSLQTHMKIYVSCSLGKR